MKRKQGSFDEDGALFCFFEEMLQLTFGERAGEAVYRRGGGVDNSAGGLLSLLCGCADESSGCY